MNTVSLQFYKHHKNYIALFCNVTKLQNSMTSVSSNYVTTIDPMDAFTLETITRFRNRNAETMRVLRFNQSGIRYFMNLENTTSKIDMKNISAEELENILQDLASKSKHNQVEEIIASCTEYRRWIGRYILHKLLQTYSTTGNIVIVKLLKRHCFLLNYSLYERNGEYDHYLAKAECMKGNSEKGLTLLQECYKHNEHMRSLYRVIIRELIHDSVLNRSEASMVVFKRHAVEYSSKWEDHYPLICLWHICWISTWFSDQMTAVELFDTSSVLRKIVQEKAMPFSVSVLRNEHNEDAVIRLLQLLLKYSMMQEYVNVLQILFAYKLKRRDLRGCTEIIRNCQVLGISLSENHQGQYVKMLIEGETDKKPEPVKDFKFKF